MANTYVDYIATAGQTDFAFSFPYLEDEHIQVLIDGVETSNFTISLSPATKVVLNTGVTSGQVVRVRRNSDPSVNLVDFVNGSVLTESDLDRAYQHNRYLNEEAFEGNTSSLQVLEGTTNFNANFNKIVNLAPPTASLDAANKDYVDDKLALSGTSLSGFNKSTHTGDGTNDQFTLSFTPQTGTASAFRVAIDGVLQTPDDAYTIDSGASTITFTSAPPTNAEIVVIATGTAQDVNSIGVTATGSTTARSLADRFADVVNVLDYGATGNGSTDDTTAIQAALDKVKSNGGGICYFPKGTYSFTVLKLENASDVSLEGEAGAVLKTTTVAAGSFVIGVTYGIVTQGTTDFTLIGAADNNPGTTFTATGVGSGTGTAVVNSTSADLPLTFNVCDNLEIKNLTISGPTGATTGTSEGLLRIFNSDHVTLMGLKFLTTGGYTVVPLQSDYLTVTQCFFNQGSLWTQGCSYSKYTNNNFLDTTYDSLKISAYIPDITQATTIYSDHVVISNNVFNGSDNDAIDTYTRGFDLIIDSNIIKGASVFGIQMKTIVRDPADYGQGGSSDVHGYNRKVIVSNNQISECGDYGLTVRHDDEQAVATDDTANYPEYFSIIGNTIVGSGASTNAGIYLRDVWKVLVSNNIVKNCDYGIQVPGGAGSIAYHININSNFVDDCVTSGIYAASTTNEHISINNNEVIGSATGILARTTRGSVCGNVISECTSRGLSLLFGQRTTVCSNVVSNVTDGATTGIGILFTRFARCTIANNIAVDNDNGFKFTANTTSDSTDGIVVGNLSSSNTTSDIIDDVTTTNFTQANNTFTI